MNWEYYKPFIRYNESWIRSDPTPLFENPEVFHNLIEDITRPFCKTDFNKIVAIDALGFVIGSAIAYKTNKPLVLIRKEGKYPNSKTELIKNSFADYDKKKKAFEVKKDSIQKGDKILLVDEWIHTGAQMNSAIKLIKKFGGKVVGISTIYVNVTKNTKKLLNNYKVGAVRIKSLS
jgi:adenine phosphoribosyltransferase